MHRTIKRQIRSFSYSSISVWPGFQVTSLGAMVAGQCVYAVLIRLFQTMRQNPIPQSEEEEKQQQLTKFDFPFGHLWGKKFVL